MALCLLLPKQYTAVATLVIEPPGADPRSATAVSSIYLESLKSYEAFASSDSLFAKACEKFHLLDGKTGPSLESFKRRVLRVDKLKDTNVLEISVTLPDASAGPGFGRISGRGDGCAGPRYCDAPGTRSFSTAPGSKWRRRGKISIKREPKRPPWQGSEPVLESEVQSLEERKARAEAQRIEANMVLAESSARRRRGIVSRRPGRGCGAHGGYRGDAAGSGCEVGRACGSACSPAARGRSAPQRGGYL